MQAHDTPTGENVNTRLVVEQPPENFTRIANEVLYAGLEDVKGVDYSAYPAISQNALTVFMALRSFDHRNGGVVWPGINLIASIARVGRTSTKGALEELRDVGLIRKESGKIKGATNTYHVSWSFPGNHGGEVRQGDVGVVAQRPGVVAQRPGVVAQRPGGGRPATRGVVATRPRRRQVEEDKKKTQEEGAVARFALVPPPSPPIVVLRFEGLRKSAGVDTWDLTEPHLKDLESAFEGINVRNQLTMAQVDIKNKAVRRIPTPQGMPRFVSNWLKIAQERQARAQAHAPAPPRRYKTNRERIKEILDREEAEAAMRAKGGSS